ncbi:Fungal specific transcription factor, putative [Coccidioides posadasii C735 delta SOWgp]|uniref:Fungal specific transcription factor, putative n=1 Tax=Coccidioides posadasii (strain C735) TaxID=222929 RepID=C5P733_COCP7|nr:Fungal specific transcription factor, putative [Coccidioides posadasii C735 delta SOWgp]EER27233.1 Fungal specific transcription factor, putative [Coccidioides posadasii C735 delta SOWgp]|eukprot:XP_003069378.1 Fungal specific transcription factor, putative [Coccidioides posadasii C735 delta SOWgp]
MPPDTGRDPFPAQRGQKRTRSRQSTVEPGRSRSNTAASKFSRPPRSRGSTASIQSCSTQYMPEQQVPEGYEPYMRSQFGPSQSVYHGNPEEMLMRFGDQLANSNPGTLLDPALQENHNSVKPRMDVHYQGHDIHVHNVAAHGLPPELSQHGMTAEMHPTHYPNLFDGVENQIPDHIIEDHEGSEQGPRKKRGTSSSIANDNELRRLLRQYDGYTLRQMAAEVQKHEGAGGKSEKVKQVFAMIWLRENCRKSTGSVRRDRVYCCYADKCGTERVSVLNPASFGKLVRIIFPNVQTRRLGVRGESKYHYVDLSIIESEPKPDVNGKDVVDQTTATTGENTQESHRMSTSSTQSHLETTKTRLANVSHSPHPQTCSHSHQNCGCHSSYASHPGSISVVDFSAMSAQEKLHLILHFESAEESPAGDNETLQLPSIHSYLPPGSDSDVAGALMALYRSHCISVIDSFRFCKEKNLFRHISAFQGTLTVPVHKLLIHPDMAPWIEECDWLMYQKMVAFIAPLTTQVVPEPVVKAFTSISRRLVPHIEDTFKSQPEHVSTARLVPARLFCHLVKRMLEVNQSANSAAAWLCHIENRTKMWEEFHSFLNITDMICKARIPRCSLQGIVDIFKEHVKMLLSPLDAPPPEVELYDQELGFQKFTYTTTEGRDYTNFPDRWIAFILGLPKMFPGHAPQCIIDKADAMWTAILHRFTLEGAESFSAWWMTKVFFMEMIQWQAEKGGFMHYSPKALRQFLLNSESATSQPPAILEQTNGSADSSIAPNPENAVTATGESEVVVGRASLNNDDSAIALDDDSMLLSGSKYADMTISDPADAEGDVVVV